MQPRLRNVFFGLCLLQIARIITEHACSEWTKFKREMPVCVNILWNFEDFCVTVEKEDENDGEKKASQGQVARAAATREENKKRGQGREARVERAEEQDRSKDMPDQCAVDGSSSCLFLVRPWSQGA